MPSSSPSPLKKLLITDPKAKAAPVSASSSSATSTPPQQMPGKRTRDQPNLSDCHCCGRRIVHSNPKDRLQPLDSVWRIVLLCRKCRRSICSGQTCPYCFKLMGDSGEFCTCRVCQRKIHKDCIRDYEKCTPWCYLGECFEGFKVCLDCWVPELLKNSVQVLGRSENRCGLTDKCESKHLSENVVHNGKCEANKNIKKVAKVKGQVSRWPKRAIDEVHSVDGESDLFSKNDRDSLKAGNSSCSGETETDVVDDAKLAFHLHRAINSSPRILRGKSLGNPNNLDARNARIWKGLSYKRSVLGKNCGEDRKLAVSTNSEEIGRMTHTAENDSSVCFNGLSRGLIAYERDRKRKIWHLDNENTEISEPITNQQATLKDLHSDEAEFRSTLMSGSDTSENSCIDGGRNGPELVSYNCCKSKKQLSHLSVQYGDSEYSSSCGEPGVAFKSECCQSDCENLFMSSLVKSDTKEVLLSGRSDRVDYRYHLKYVKRTRGTKTDSCFLHPDTSPSEIQVSAPVASFSDGLSANGCELILSNGICAHTTDRYSFKYSKRVKSLSPPSNSEAKLHT